MSSNQEKKLPLSGWSCVGPFIFYSAIVFPVWLVVLLPTTLVIQAGKRVFGSRRTRLSEPLPPLTAAEVTSVQQLQLPVFDAREFDLVLFGATGFTGRLALRYLIERYGVNKKVRWAIAGRRRDALEGLLREMAAIDPQATSVPVLVADTSKAMTVAEVVRRTRVVASTVGPFSLYGTPLVQLCALMGTSYVDITGESDWVRNMIDKFDDVAKASGARIVHFCGHDCVPWDLAVYKLAEKIRAVNPSDELKEVALYDEIFGELSGGTLQTIFTSLFDRKPAPAALGFDPLIKDADGKRSENKLSAKNQKFLGYNQQFKSWVGPFVMAMVMANCVRRSNAVNGYGRNVTYKEALVYPGLMAGVVNTIQNLVFATMLFCPPLRAFMTRFVLPKPGEGPSVETMDKGFLRLTAFAKGVSGTRAQAVMYFPTDPGYRDTARMLVESGLALSLDRAHIKTPAGVHTPATCMPQVLLDRLVASGTTFQMS
eukprot:m.82470 g.82470  ORF g.82470 m.82470 type:complete len:484 (+) comp14920_c0_seq1:129-1580(+)